jgi:hypothetical protein
VLPQWCVCFIFPLRTLSLVLLLHFHCIDSNYLSSPDDLCLVAWESMPADGVIQFVLAGSQCAALTRNEFNCLAPWSQL